MQNIKMSSKSLVEEKLSNKFFEFLSATSNAMNDVLSLQEQKFADLLKEEQEKLENVINGKEKTIKTLNNQLDYYSKQKKNRTNSLYFSFAVYQNKKSLEKCLKE